MELVLGGLGAFVVEVLLIALLLAPRWTLRTLARPFRGAACARPWRRGHTRQASSAGTAATQRA